MTYIPTYENENPWHDTENIDRRRHLEEAQDLFEQLPDHLQVEEMRGFCAAIVRKVEEMI